MTPRVYQVLALAERVARTDHAQAATQLLMLLGCTWRLLEGRFGLRRMAAYVSNCWPPCDPPSRFQEVVRLAIRYALWRRLLQLGPLAFEHVAVAAVRGVGEHTADELMELAGAAVGPEAISEVQRIEGFDRAAFGLPDLTIEPPPLRFNPAVSSQSYADPYLDYNSAEPAAVEEYFSAAGLAPSADDALWKRIEECSARGRHIPGIIAATVPYGLRVDLSDPAVPAFLPFSQIVSRPSDIPRIRDPERWIGQRLSFKIFRFERIPGYVAVANAAWFNWRPFSGSSAKRATTASRRGDKREPNPPGSSAPSSDAPPETLSARPRRPPRAAREGPVDMTRYWEFAAALFPPLAPDDGYSPEHIQRAEEIVAESIERRFKFPQALKEVYLRSAKREDLHRTQDILLGPSLEEDEDHLLIYGENQGVCVWGIRVQDAGKKDPPVYCCDEGDSNWTLDHDRLSGFLFTALLWERVNGEPCEISSLSEKQRSDLIEQWEPVALEGYRRRGDLRFYRRQGAVAAVYPAKRPEEPYRIHLGARDPALLESALASIGRGR